MSVFNEKEEWLRQSIESILNQTFRNFEFIIINDNPQRNINSKILSEYKDRDKRIETIMNSENIGLTKSLNVGLKLAKGDYVARMDGDDISLPDRFKNQLKEFELDDRLVVLGTQGKYIFEDQRTNLLMEKPVSNAGINWVLAAEGSPIIHSSAMFRRVDKNGKSIFYNEEFRKKQDFELWSRLVRQGFVKNLDFIGILYRIHKNQTVKSYDIKDYLLSSKVLAGNLEYIYRVSAFDAKKWADSLNSTHYKKDNLKICVYLILPFLSGKAKNQCENKDELDNLKKYVAFTYGKFTLRSIKAKMFNVAFKSWIYVFKHDLFYSFLFILQKIKSNISYHYSDKK